MGRGSSRLRSRRSSALKVRADDGSRGRGGSMVCISCSIVWGADSAWNNETGAASSKTLGTRGHGNGEGGKIAHTNNHCTWLRATQPYHTQFQCTKKHPSHSQGQIHKEACNKQYLLLHRKPLTPPWYGTFFNMYNLNAHSKKYMSCAHVLTI